MSCKTLSFLSIWVHLFLISISYSHAASVRQVTMDEMLTQCQFVFEGKVLSIETKENDQNRIHTYVTFEIQDIIKGEYPSNIIILSFLGGTVGQVTMSVSDMKVPQLGEHGIYFVETLERSQVHPLYGWSQGHFLIQSDNTGVDRVMTGHEQPVTEIMQDGSAEQMNSNRESIPTTGQGVARGIGFALRKGGNKGLTSEEFKRILREKTRMNQ